MSALPVQTEMKYACTLNEARFQVAEETLRSQTLHCCPQETDAITAILYLQLFPRTTRFLAWNDHIFPSSYTVFRGKIFKYSLGSFTLPRYYDAYNGQPLHNTIEIYGILNPCDVTEFSSIWVLILLWLPTYAGS